MTTQRGVPEAWQKATLAEISQENAPIVYGIVQAGPHIEDGVPYIKSSDVGGSINADSLQRTSEEIAYKYRRAEVCPGDIVFSLRGNIGQLSIVPHSLPRANLTQGTARIRVSPSYDAAFVKHMLKSFAITKHIAAVSKGSTFQEISLEALRKIELTFPPLKEQRKIANIISTWDEAIEQQTRLLELKRERKRGLMQQLLTGKVRFKEFEGLERSQVALQEVADVFMGSSPSSTAYNDEEIGLPLLQGNADIKNRRSKPKVWTTEVTRECRIGDILMSVRAPVGTVSLSLHHACIGRGIAAVRAKSSATVQDYLYQYLLHLEPAWARLSQGSTFEAVNSKDLKELPITVPRELEEQQKIAAVLSAADAELETLEKQLAALRTQKRGLMQRLLTGKTRVKVDAAPAEAAVLP